MLVQLLDRKRGAVGPAAHRSSLISHGCISRAKFRCSRDQALRRPPILGVAILQGDNKYESYRVVRRYAIHISYAHPMRSEAMRCERSNSIWWLALEFQAIRHKDARTSITNGTASR